jgi:hypothetical protein
VWVIAAAKVPSVSAFLSAILPPYARPSKSLQVLIPILYLKGISLGDFADALIALPAPRSEAASAVDWPRARGRADGTLGFWQAIDSISSWR